MAKELVLINGAWVLREVTPDTGVTSTTSNNMFSQMTYSSYIAAPIETSSSGSYT